MHPAVKAAFDQEGITYQVWEHARLSVPIQSPADFAEALGYPLGRITKTLLLMAPAEARAAVAVLPCDARLDFSAAAERLGVRRLRLATRSELDEILGYPPTGVAPVVPSTVAVLVDATLLEHPTILVGAGLVGVEAEVAPGDLVRLTGALVADLTTRA